MSLKFHVAKIFRMFKSNCIQITDKHTKITDLFCFTNCYKDKILSLR